MFVRFGRRSAALISRPTAQRFVLSRGMAKDAAPAKGAGDKKDAKAPAAAAGKPLDTKSEEEKKADAAAKKKAALAALIVSGPKRWKGRLFHPSDVGPEAAVFSSFPPAPKPVRKPHPDSLLRWRVAGAAVVERIPLKPSDPTPLDIEYAALLEANTKRTVARYVPPDLTVMKKPGSNASVIGASTVEAEGEGMGWGTDEVDAEELANRKRAQEEADERDPIKRAAIDADMKNIRRKRSERLYLIVRKPRDPKEHDWGFPQGGFEKKKDAFNLRTTAERELAEECGAALHVHPMSNAPIGHLVYKFKPEVKSRLNLDGQKVFYHHMLYLEGDIKLDRSELDDYAWATKQELITKYFVHSPELVEITTKMLR